MHETLTNFFAASNRHELGKMAECFASDAVVHDVGEDLRIQGLPAIRNWLEETRSKYRLQTRILETEGGAEATQVLAEVSGTFDGSPLRFRYEFKLRDGAITFLSTTYVEE